MRFSNFFPITQENGLPVAYAIRQERTRCEVPNIRYGRRHLVALLSVLLSSCYATSSSLDLREKTPVPAGESVVFGRVNVIMDNAPITWKYTLMGRQEPGMFRIHVLSDATSQVVSHGLTGNGFFVWHLPPGSYTIAGFRYHVQVKGRITARFTVPPGTPLLYIGTLEIQNLFRTNIVDDFDDANRDLRTRFPDLQGNAVKSLMKLERPN